MNKNQRIRYHAELWPAACEAQGWNPKDDARRRDIVTQCLIDIGVCGEDSGEISSSALDEAQITALFVFLQHLGAPNHIGLAQEWDNCRAGYVAYHKSKQADWWQRQAGNAANGKWVRNRFAGRPTAKPAPFGLDEPLAEKEAGDRLMTMRRLARKKGASTASRRKSTSAVEQADLLPAPRNIRPSKPVAAPTNKEPDDAEMPF